MQEESIFQTKANLPKHDQYLIPSESLVGRVSFSCFAKSWQVMPADFVNKVLLEFKHARLCIICGCFPATMAELRYH